MGTPSPTISAGNSTCSTDHRHRRAWQEISDDERQLYIDGFKALADEGLTQMYTQTHLESSEHSSSKFLPWHREYIYRFEDSIRDLGGRFECFTLPYWDWSREPLPTDVARGSKLFIFDSGLGADSDGDCVRDP